jgi:hypothetical protein
MYRHCIYCSGLLGGNEALDEFPVGRTVAFDPARGRLWAVCQHCARWNLAPLEERWEAVESAERSYLGCRLRVQRENIGVARFADDTRLVRVGAAPPGELAAWRYGAQLLRRRRWFWPLAVATGVIGLMPYVPLGVAASLAPALWFGGFQYARAQRRVIRFAAHESPTQRPLDIRGAQVAGAVVRSPAPGAELRLEVPMEGLLSRTFPGLFPPKAGVVTLTGPAARLTVERAMPLVNRFGGNSRAVQEAVRVLAGRESAADTLHQVAQHGARLTLLGVTGSHRTGGAPVTGPRALAFEMALHEESERRALEGELVLLESAWRQAEALAAVADSLVELPGEAPDPGLLSSPPSQLGAPTRVEPQ